MEATHLGAWFSARTDSDLQNAISILSNAPLYSPIFPWLDAAFEVRKKYPLQSTTGRSLGIPTWLYGHEPPTCFATDIAKYFANSVREEGLLAIAKNGVIFAPGNEGTIQEIFQAAAQNRYETFEHASPMVFFGKQFWTQQKPVYPLLRKIASQRDYDQLIFISDDRNEVMDHIVAFRSRQMGTE